jgi:hypothetical protein
LFSEFKKDDIEEFSSSEEDIENKFKNFFKKKGLFQIIFIEILKMKNMNQKD